LLAEFGDNQRDSRYFVIRKSTVSKGVFAGSLGDLRFASRSRPPLGSCSRAFSVDECTPELDSSRLMEVFAI
jgi:hypothetical protein